MHAAVRHGTPSLTSLKKDGEVSCEVRPPRSDLRGQTSEVTHPESDLTRQSLTSVTWRRLYKALGHSPHIYKLCAYNERRKVNVKVLPHRLSIFDGQYETFNLLSCRKGARRVMPAWKSYVITFFSYQYSISMQNINRTVFSQIFMLAWVHFTFSFMFGLIQRAPKCYPGRSDNSWLLPALLEALATWLGSSQTSAK